MQRSLPPIRTCFLLLAASCGDASEPAVVETIGEAETHAEEPQTPVEGQEASTEEAQVAEADRRPSFERPDLVFIQNRDVGPDDIDPSTQRLEPLTSFGGEEVVFYEEFHPGTERLRVQGHRLARSIEGETIQHGPEWRWFDNGQLQLRRIYDHGRVEGDYVDWFEAGFMKSAGRIEGDRYEGEWVRWGRNGGRLKEVSTWLDGQNEGLQYLLWPRGELKSIVSWKQGKKDGLERVWSPEGLPRQVRGWSAGIEHGETRQWNEQDVLVRSGGFERGKRHGAWREWHADGVLRLSGSFDHGARVGEWTSWSPAGDQIALEHYEAGSLHGQKQLWSPEGVLVFQGRFEHGQPDGEHLEFYLGGGPKSVANYSNGVLNGARVDWHASGGKQSEGPMVDGKRHGRWTVWNEQGEVLTGYGGLFEHGKRVAD